MKKAITKKDSVYQFLDSSGVLESGNNETITKVRKQYWREYKAKWRKQKRKAEKELTTSWTPSELKELTGTAKFHNMSCTGYIKASSQAYTNKAYVIPDRAQVRRIEQLLALSYNAIMEMTDENTLTLKDIKILLERLTELERQVRVSLHSPKTLDQMIIETIRRIPNAKSHLFHLLETIS